jgi:group I intron endonuclease
MAQNTQRLWALYRITNLINNKVYIGQTVQPSKRWNQHRNDSAKPKYPIHYSINKHGAHNFEFEVIAYCKSQDDANWIEEELIKQYDSLVKNGKGYNISLGGLAAPKSDEWIQAMKNWHASLSTEERAEISRKQSEATLKQIEKKGHPAAGRIVTEGEKELHRKARLDNPLEYTDELRQKMSEAHIGNKDSDETKQRKSERAKEAWTKRISYDGIKCQAPGCDVEGKHKYKLINNVRYCNKHGLRMLRYGRLDLANH